MRLFKNVLFACILTLTTFSIVTYTACKKDPCKNVVCLNGGSCNNGNCICPTGYEGTHCESKIDPCRGVTCQNGGICSDGKCACPFPYTGTLCETELRTKYFNTYKGAAYMTSSFGNDTLQVAKVVFKTNSANPAKMFMEISDNSGSSTDVLTLEVILLTATTFNIPAQDADGTTFSGSGSINETKASFTMTGIDAGYTTNYNFPNLAKQ